MRPIRPRFLPIFLAALLLPGLLAGCGPLLEGPTPTPMPTLAPATPKPSNPDTWLVLLYQDADDEILERDIFIDLNEAEMVGSTDQVKIVAQMDRFYGAFDGDGDWTSTRRYLVTQDDNMDVVRSQELADLGEVDMGNKASLVNFATWAIQNYPAEKYVLILSDHGAGWLGGWSDNDPVYRSTMRLQDIDEALAEIIAGTGIGRFELVGMDACLMGQLEVVSALSPHARYAVLSEETEPALGWAYAEMLRALNDNPGMSGRELGQVIVESYIDQDKRITDRNARRALVEDLGLLSDPGASELARQMSNGATLAAVDLSAVRDVNAALNELATALTGVGKRDVAAARSYAESFTSVFGNDVPPSYLDLGHFASLLEDQIGDANVSAAVRQLLQALQRAVVAEKHGREKPGASGLSIYFPNSTLYQATVSRQAELRYPVYAGRFAAASLWDDYLTYHYADKTFDPQAADLSVLGIDESANTDFQSAAEGSAPDPNAPITPPGAGVIKITPIQVSAEAIPTDGKVTLSTEVSGKNIGYIYYYVSYFSEEDNAYLTADMGFIGAEETREIAGVYYPDWGEEGKVSIELDWEPTIYYMSDGNEENDQFAFFEPEIYGVTQADDVYTVRGVYTFAKGGKKRDAVIKFSGEGQMLSVLGFSGAESTGAPREIVPKAGDTFTIIEEWLEFDKNPEGEFTDYEGGIITFGKKHFEMVPYYAYAGKYILGIIVEDMNGNSTAEYVEVTVTE